MGDERKMLEERLIWRRHASPLQPFIKDHHAVGRWRRLACAHLRAGKGVFAMKWVNTQTLVKGHAGERETHGL